MLGEELPDLLVEADDWPEATGLENMLGDAAVLIEISRDTDPRRAIARYWRWVTEERMMTVRKCVNCPRAADAVDLAENAMQSAVTQVIDDDFFDHYEAGLLAIASEIREGDAIAFKTEYNGYGSCVGYWRYLYNYLLVKYPNLSEDLFLSILPTKLTCHYTIKMSPDGSRAIRTDDGERLKWFIASNAHGHFWPEDELLEEQLKRKAEIEKQLAESRRKAETRDRRLRIDKGIQETQAVRTKESVILHEQLIAGGYEWYGLVEPGCTRFSDIDEYCIAMLGEGNFSYIEGIHLNRDGGFVKIFNTGYTVYRKVS